MESSSDCNKNQAMSASDNVSTEITVERTTEAPVSTQFIYCINTIFE